MVFFILGMENAFVKTTVILVTLFESFTGYCSNVSEELSEIGTTYSFEDDPGGLMIRPALKGRFLSKTMMLAAVFVVASGVFYVPQAHASFSETLTSANVGQSFTVDWNLPAGTYNEEQKNGTYSSVTLTSPLTALGTFTVQSLTSSQLDLAGTIDNTTALNSSLTQAYLMSLGIGSTPIGTASLSTTGSVFNAVSPGNGPNETFPGGFKGINACIFNSGGKCAGQSITDGLASGSYDSFVLALSGLLGFSPSIIFSEFTVKFQPNEGSYKIAGNTLSEKPEPGTLALIGTALLLGVGPTLRRRLLPALSEGRRG